VSKAQSSRMYERQEMSALANEKRPEWENTHPVP